MLLTDFNATTPQSKVVENMLKAAATLDIKNMVPFISKNFKLQTFPKVADLPDEPMVTTLERYGVVFSSMEKLEFDLHEVIEAPGKVVLHLSAMCHPHDGDKIDYDSLCIYTVIEEDGELKVDRCQDFCDPEKRGNLHSWVARSLGKRAT